MDYYEFAPPTVERMLLGEQTQVDVIRQALLSIIDALSGSDDLGHLPSISGIYFLIEKKRRAVAYVGTSVDISQRWKGHELKHLMLDRSHLLRWKELDKENFCCREHEEASFIAFLRPKYNRGAKFKVSPEWWKHGRSE